VAAGIVSAVFCGRSCWFLTFS